MKLAFIGNSKPPNTLLEMFRRQTPNDSGVWGDLIGVDNYNEAQVFGVIDRLPDNLKHLETKCVFLGAHPPDTHYAYQDMSNFKGIKMYDCKHLFGFGEWWLNHNYNYLTDLQPPKKIHDLGCIMSNSSSQIYHIKRRQYIERYANHHKNLNLYGRVVPWGNLKACYNGFCGSNNEKASDNDHMSGKEKVYSMHRYALEFDASGGHYFSERIFDCLLMWCYPIYWGGNNLHEYIPKESFSYLDIDGKGEDVMNIINSKIYDQRIEAIKEARDILLNRLQIWPRIHEAIFGVCR